MTLRVGRIPFLVCAPFFFNSVGRENEFPEVAFVDGPPSAHSAGLKDGSIHLSPASSITFAQKPGAFVLSPVLCTSCSFEVRSVKLFSRYPISELSGKNIRMTSQSKTSVTLLRILLENRYGLKPEYVPGLAAESTDDACLLIGDLALEENERHRFAYSYDLGTLWQEWQGLPFVFGAWLISKEALSARLRPRASASSAKIRRRLWTYGLRSIRCICRAPLSKTTLAYSITDSPTNANSHFRCFSNWPLK